MNLHFWPYPHHDINIMLKMLYFYWTLSFPFWNYWIFFNLFNLFRVSHKGLNINTHAHLCSVSCPLASCTSVTKFLSPSTGFWHNSGCVFEKSTQQKLCRLFKPLLALNWLSFSWWGEVLTFAWDYCPVGTPCCVQVRKLIMMLKNYPKTAEINAF